MAVWADGAALHDPPAKVKMHFILTTESVINWRHTRSCAGVTVKGFYCERKEQEDAPSDFLS